MKRVIGIGIMILLVFAFYMFLTPGNRKPVLIDYTQWEEACIREYDDNKGAFVFIDLTKRVLCFFKDGELIKKYRIAIGTKDSPSPIGIYKITEKGEWGKGFGGRWMGLNVPWGIYGIHGTTKPGSIGRAASHGCIRMRNRDVIELYDMVDNGTIVEIYGGPFGPFGTGFRVLHPGDTGADVVEVQRNLKLKGYYKGELSGYYSLSTERALNSFQKDRKLIISNVINAEMYRELDIILEE